MTSTTTRATGTPADAGTLHGSAYRAGDSTRIDGEGAGKAQGHVQVSGAKTPPRNQERKVKSGVGRQTRGRIISLPHATPTSLLRALAVQIKERHPRPVGARASQHVKPVLAA